jgi:transcriptional regulator with XRE-family HTH domain
MNTFNSIYVTFSTNVLNLRTEQSLTQTQLANKMGTSPGFVCDYEKGRRNPTLATVERFSIALGCSVSALLTPASEV